MDDARLKRRQLIEGAISSADDELKAEQERLERRLKEITEERYALGAVWRSLVEQSGVYAEDKPLPPALKELLEDDPGMTQRIRSILKANAGQEFSPPQIRDMVAETGFNLEGRSNPLSEVHMVLKRLAARTKEHVTAHETEAGTLYKYSRGVAYAVPSRPITRLKKKSALKQST
ncbi:MAG: hypothetical protein LAP38_07815 [Acidobacteriia bacterium]|nr:hypothetical protein [Terriglobia bacterium]